MARLNIGRLVNESVIITAANGQRVKVKVYEIDRHKVRLAIEADESVTVDREEIDERKRAGRPARPA